MIRKKTIQAGVILIILGIAAFRFFFVPFRFSPAGKQPFVIRVRLAHSPNRLELGAQSRCEIRDVKTGNLLEKEAVIPHGTEVSPADTGIKLGSRIFAAEGIRISPSRGAGITLNGTLYRGEMDIIRAAGELDAVNRVELEGYLKGVVPCEINRFWPFAVIKAQAIVSRSFAVHEALRRKDKDYDLTADTFSQVYGGLSSERWRTTRAVEATRDRVLEYEGRVLPAYFHSCCGGHTQDASRIWGTGLQPLRGVKCLWCRWSPYFRWQVRVSTQTILERLNSRGYRFKRIDDIRTGPRDGSGRVEYVRMRSNNKWFEIKTKDLRSAVGRRVLKSANFHVKKYPLFYLFSGYGWGHGVGMCQWGAFGLSLRRWSAERILQRYYPGAKITRLKRLLEKRDGPAAAWGMVIAYGDMWG
ncbi:MAG: hypothetical protein DRP85_00115 [Candidatus Makaraimicrobium thalassicum]|nr:MAG: hypothetical protein DRP85_00115 [Candidatus Omnitrophota bacterium]